MCVCKDNYRMFDTFLEKFKFCLIVQIFGTYKSLRQVQ